jgi:hypothetical protein
VITCNSLPQFIATLPKSAPSGCHFQVKVFGISAHDDTATMLASVYADVQVVPGTACFGQISKRGARLDPTSTYSKIDPTAPLLQGDVIPFQTSDHSKYVMVVSHVR